jgi:hypothetical protein
MVIFPYSTENEMPHRIPKQILVIDGYSSIISPPVSLEAHNPTACLTSSLTEARVICPGAR